MVSGLIFSSDFAGLVQKQIDKRTVFFHRVPSRFKRLYEFLNRLIGQ
ncbi:hypothetical protein SAMN04487963_1892 [Marinobacter zhejiangensis]|uniref:Uncharacterized protein n=1 Tax=Marinobacter zhejiangensis TaxID=488535 RepID=A0A1I4PAN0_9GAMM|nr:hypothetical protein SAMN04487963_1892 [Marinobacter zhejiangensis]